jgi:hypothetical protein
MKTLASLDGILLTGGEQTIRIHSEMRPETLLFYNTAKEAIKFAIAR